VRTDVRVVNLSLLNTPWYIKQLKYDEPVVPISLDDRQIEAMVPERWQTQVVHIPLPDSVRRAQMDKIREASEVAGESEVPRSLSFSMAPTYPENHPTIKPYLIRIQDKMVRQILEDTQWKKPIYFAVTVARNNMIGLYRHLRMDGLAYAITPFPVTDEVSPEKLEENLNNFRYTNLDNPDVFYNTNIIKLLQNYRSAYVQLARYFYRMKDNEKALEVLGKMDERIPAKVIKYSHERMAMFVAELYESLGKKPEAEEQINSVLEGIYVNPAEQALLQAGYAVRMGEYNQAEGILRDYFQNYPFNMTVFDELLWLWLNTKQYYKGIYVLQDFKRRYGTNAYIDGKLKQFERLAVQDSAGSRP
jgi:hypothetical protein